jgi:Cof subfamily protein (haloacid dehalogenase superfamily)
VQSSVEGDGEVGLAHTGDLMPSTRFAGMPLPNGSTLRLLALDVDGTLLRNDGNVAPRDREAIASALEAGVAVTLATGRLSSSALPFARALSLEVPLVCADGAVLFCPKRQIPLRQRPLGAAGLSTFLARLRQHGLAPFVFNHQAVCGAAGDFARYPFVSGWTDELVAHDDLDRAAAGSDHQAPITAIGVGGSPQVAAIMEALRGDPSVSDEVVVFPIRTTDHWVVRLSPGGCSKAVGLGHLVEDLGFAADEVAVVGDWYNDVPMLEWARYSFAMGQAPEEVKRAAKTTLRATAETGGAIAEALAWLVG